MDKDEWLLSLGRSDSAVKFLLFRAEFYLFGLF